ncbi:MAG: hypothetical protein M1838_004352 [Thelocarpon superellum]|nr:MAG: hypothetical protein M1838_004352 [Thelocarpon superellum]
MPPPNPSPPSSGHTRSDEPGPASTTAPPKKTRSSNPTAPRGIAHLTAEQLAKKRANDREAQRAIRERTKNQIAGFEAKIRELTSRQSYQELQQALREKKAVEAENHDIRSRLQHVLQVIQPLLSQEEAGALARGVASPAPAAAPGARGGPDGAGYASPTTRDSAGVFQATHHSIDQIHLPPSGDARLHILPLVSKYSPSHSSGVDSPSSSLSSHPLSADAAEHLAQWAGAAMSHPHQIKTESPTIPHEPLKVDRAYGLGLTGAGSGDRHGLDFILDGSPRVHKEPGGDSPAGTKMEHDYSPAGLSPARFSPGGRVARGESEGSIMPGRPMVAYATPVMNVPATCPLDSLLLKFIHDRQSQAALGVSPNSIVGPASPSVAPLIYRGQTIFFHPIFSFLAEILATFPDISSLPEQIGVAYGMSLVLRWQISPTEENYELLPEWITPRPCQLFTPHPAWIDHLPWPRMRDRLVRDYDQYPFDDFFVPFTKTISVNWPHDPMETFVPSSEPEQVIINPVFERHIRDLKNWSVGPAFATAFPRLAEAARVHDAIPPRT